MKRLFFLILSFSLLIVLLNLPVFVSAHLDAGLDDVVNGYSIDLGYSPSNLTTSESAILNFNILNDSTQKLVNVSSIWIRISESNKSVFAGAFQPNDGNINFLYTFPKQGNYTLVAKFYNGTNVIAEKSYSLKVTESQAKVNIWNNPKYTTIVLLLILAIILILCSVRYVRKK